MSTNRIADAIARRLSWSEIDPNAVRQLIRLARLEDLEGWGLTSLPEQVGDVTSQAIESGGDLARSSLVAREEMVICGLGLIPLILQEYGPGAAFQSMVDDGTYCPAGTVVGRLTGPARMLLESERVLLNFLQRLSGVASTTRRYVDAMGTTTTRLLDTRKTTPGYRVLEKYAVACGGGYNHRMGLFDRVMLKDNHLAADKASHGEALTRLVDSVRKKWPEMVIELEVDRLEQIPPALDSGVTVILLDNFSVEELKQAIHLIDGIAATEASGGITIDNLPELSAIGLDFISTGATVHKATWKDIGLDWEV